MPRGVPQIEITYDVDANGILTVSAVEKSTGATKDITITNDNNRLNKEDIEDMIANAEKYKKEDEERKEFIETKNKYEDLVYSTKNSQESLKDKLSEEDKQTIDDIVKTHSDWLLENSQLEVSAEHLSLFKNKQEELEKVVTPIFSKHAGQGIPGGMPGGMPGGIPGGMPGGMDIPVQEDNEPTIESVD